MMSGYCDLCIFAVFKFMLIFHCIYIVMVAFAERATQKSEAALEWATGTEV
jgi:hypothetical protein